VTTTPITKWRVTLGADSGLSYVILRESGGTVTVTRANDGSGNDATTREVWSALSEQAQWFVTEWTLGKQDSRVAEKRHPRPSASSVSFDSTITWNDAHWMRALHCPNT
jgi:hypothetical protein